MGGVSHCGQGSSSPRWGVLKQSKGALPFQEERPFVSAQHETRDGKNVKWELRYVDRAKVIRGGVEGREKIFFSLLGAKLERELGMEIKNLQSRRRGRLRLKKFRFEAGSLLKVGHFVKAKNMGHS